MSTPLELVLAFAIAAVVSCAVVPLAIRVAHRTGFLDRPVGYKVHRAPTPYLGGLAIIVAFLCAEVPLGGLDGRLGVLVGCAVLLWSLGTLDDRHPVSPGWRLAAELAVVVALWRGGLHWDILGSPVLSFAVTTLWVIGVVNAFNLMDNLDGASSTVAGISTLAIAALAILHGQYEWAIAALALSGACAGFLPWNLSRPARIFLGDGGSITLGFLVASLSMIVVQVQGTGSSVLLLGALLAGLPIVDTTLIVISRSRRRIGILTGGRDHLNHRLLASLGSTHNVALALAIVQGGLVSLAVIGDQLGKAAPLAVGILGIVEGVAIIVCLEHPHWTGALPAMARAPLAAPGELVLSDARPRYLVRFARRAQPAPMVATSSWSAHDTGSWSTHEMAASSYETGSFEIQ